jgi:tetratricopeptide (TPR) repeat protein
VDKFLSFIDILNIYLDEGQVNDYLKNNNSNISALAISNEVNLLDPQFNINRRIQIENLITQTEKELPKVKIVDLFLYLSKQAINIGFYNLAEDILNLLIRKIEKIEKLKDYLANAYFKQGEIYFRQGYWKKAETTVTKAKKIFHSEKNRGGAFKCDNLLSAVLGEKGDLNKALKNFQKTLQSVNPKKEKYLYSMIESNIGILCQAVHSFDESIAYLNRALIYFEQIHDLTRVAELKYNIANLYYLKKDYPLAVNKLDNAIAAALEAENLNSLCLCYITKADALFNLNDITMANAIIDIAMVISCKINDRLSIAEVYKIKGKVEFALKNLDYAENLLLTSLRLNGELENKYNLAETCLALSKLYKMKKNSKESARYQILALLYFNEIQMKPISNKIVE